MKGNATHDDGDVFDQVTSARLAGVTVAQFQRWGLRPVKRIGRRAFYRWVDVRQMAATKRANRTRSYGADDERSPLDRAADDIAERGIGALERGDMRTAQRQIELLQELCRASGMPEREITGRDEPE